MGVAYVQAGAFNGTAVAMPAAQTAGNINIIAVATFNSSSTPANVGDFKGNTYTLLGNYVPNTSFGGVWLYGCFSIAAAGAGVNTLNAITVATGTVTSSFFEFSNVNNTQDGSTQTGSGSGTAMTHANLTTTANTNDLLLSVGVNGGGSSITNTTGNGYTVVWNQTSMQAAFAYQIITNSTGPFNGGLTSNGSGQWVVMGMAFKGGTAPVQPSVSGLVSVTATTAAGTAVVQSGLTGNVSISGSVTPVFSPINVTATSGLISISGTVNPTFSSGGGVTATTVNKPWYLPFIN